MTNGFMTFGLLSSGPLKSLHKEMGKETKLEYSMENLKPDFFEAGLGMLIGLCGGFQVLI